MKSSCPIWAPEITNLFLAIAEKGSMVLDSNHVFSRFFLKVISTVALRHSVVSAVGIPDCDSVLKSRWKFLSDSLMGRIDRGVFISPSRIGTVLAFRCTSGATPNKTKWDGRVLISGLRKCVFRFTLSGLLKVIRTKKLGAGRGRLLRGYISNDCSWPIVLKKSASVSTAEKYASEIEICILRGRFRARI